MPGVDANATIRAVWSFESAKVIGRVTRMVRDVGLAEDFAQDALVAALEAWPRDGVPDNPGAWLMTAAKRRALNHLQREKLAERKREELGAEPAAVDAAAVLAAGLDDEVGDDALRLIFIACHPVVPPEAQVALTLRMIGGLTTGEIARAFLTTEGAIQQRIVRAKRTLTEAAPPFEVPRGAERGERLASVLEVIYLIFNEGHSATTGDDVMRPGLCEDALRFGRLVAKMMPDEAEPHGLVALMELHQSRAGARRGAGGEPVLLLAQDRARWDRGHVARGLAALARADELVATRGPYAVQAAISACHARAGKAEETEWAKIAELYGELGQIVPSPVVELNRAVAVAMARGPAAGLAILDELSKDEQLADYHLLPSARADLLVKLGRKAEAKAEFERAARMTRNEREREMLLASAAECM